LVLVWEPAAVGSSLLRCFIAFEADAPKHRVSLERMSFLKKEAARSAVNAKALFHFLSAEYRRSMI